MKSPGQLAYEAYNAGGSDPAFVNRNYRGDPCPAWADLPENVREKWANAAAEVGAVVELARDHARACPFIVAGGDLRLASGEDSITAGRWLVDLLELMGVSR